MNKLKKSPWEEWEEKKIEMARVISSTKSMEDKMIENKIANERVGIHRNILMLYILCFLLLFVGVFL